MKKKRTRSCTRSTCCARDECGRAACLSRPEYCSGREQTDRKRDRQSERERERERERGRGRERETLTGTAAARDVGGAGGLRPRV